MNGLTKQYASWPLRGWLVAVGVALTALAMAGNARAAPPIAVPPGARDVSAEWRAFQADGKLDAARIEAAFATVRGVLAGTKIVVVPSYLTDLLIDAGELHLTDYFRSEIAALNAAGIETELAPVDTEQSVAENGRRLAAHIAASRRPVCLVSHSKGGLDTLEFLLRATPETRRRIACWVSLQAPFGGSPVADLIVTQGWTRELTDPALRALGGSGRSLDDLTVAERSQYMRANADAIQSLGGNLPILALATYLDDASTPSLHLAATYRWMADKGIANDGLVPLASALLPGARYIVVPNLDHTDTVAARPILSDPVDRVLLWKVLLYLVLSNRPA